MLGRITHPPSAGNQPRSESGRGKWIKTESVDPACFLPPLSGFPRKRPVSPPIESEAIPCKLVEERMGTIMKRTRCNYWLGAGLGAAALLLVATAWADNDPNSGASTPAPPGQSDT